MMAIKSLSTLLVLGFFLVGCNEVPVVQDLSQSQAHAVVAGLADNGIESSAERAKGSKGLYTIKLSTDDYARAIQVLRDLGLPKEERQSVSQLLTSDSLLPPGREIEMLKIDRALAGEIEELLAVHPAIVSARAVVRSASLQHTSALQSGQSPSVSLVVTVRAALAEDQIKSLVRQIATGVAPENISIAIETARAAPKVVNNSANQAERLSSFLFFWKVPQSEVFGLNVAVFGLIVLIAVIAAGLGFVSGSARAVSAATGAELSRPGLPGGPSVTGNRLRLSGAAGQGSSEDSPS